MVPYPDRRGRPVRPDQHGRRGRRLRRPDRPGPGGDRGGGGRRPPRPAPPGDLLRHPAQLPPPAARPRRTRRPDPRVAGGPAPVTGEQAAGGGVLDQQGPCATYPTSLGTSDADTITLLGHDLAADLMGQVGFGELALWLVTQRRPSASQVRVFEAVLVALADHGFTPTAIAARLTYLSAPDSVQGALAAGLLGGGSRFLGVTEDAGRFLAATLSGADGVPVDDAAFDALALAAVRAAREQRRL